MILLTVRRLMVIAFMASPGVFTYAQPAPAIETVNSKESKPYKILTSGRQITIKSKKEIKTVIVWTASGNRIVEDKSVNSTSFSINISVSEKVFFIMIQYEGSKPYTEKIGVE